MYRTEWYPIGQGWNLWYNHSYFIATSCRRMDLCLIGDGSIIIILLHVKTLPRCTDTPREKSKPGFIPACMHISLSYVHDVCVILSKRAGKLSCLYVLL